jgi:hypothetical protein
MLDGRQVDEQLEQRASLAFRVYGTVKLALLVIAAANHCEDRTIRRHRDQSCL